MEGFFPTQLISILGSMVVSSQNGVGFPSGAVKIGVVCGKSTASGLILACLQPFVCFSKGGVYFLLGSCKKLLSSWPHSSFLNYQKITFHPGCGLWIAVLPYLLVEPNLLLSMRASLLRLKPVVESPSTFLASLSWLKDCLAMGVYPFPWIFSGFT